MNARTGSLPHDLAGSLSPEQMKVWWAKRAQQAREQYWTVIDETEENRMQNAIAVKPAEAEERLLTIARELRRLAGQAYGKPVRVPVTADALRGFATEIEGIVAESQTEHHG